MENMLDTAVSVLSSADVWMVAIAGLLAALAGIAKLTKTKKDDEAIAKVTAGLNKVRQIIVKLKPASTGSKATKK